MKIGDKYVYGVPTSVSPYTIIWFDNISVVYEYTDTNNRKVRRAVSVEGFNNRFNKIKEKHTAWMNVPKTWHGFTAESCAKAYCSTDHRTVKVEWEE